MYDYAPDQVLNKRSGMFSVRIQEGKQKRKNRNLNERDLRKQVKLTLPMNTNPESHDYLDYQKPIISKILSCSLDVLPELQTCISNDQVETCTWTPNRHSK